eukprot:scaffold186030_cov33-Prasinocladus_malaysianus.AAC.1
MNIHNSESNPGCVRDSGLVLSHAPPYVSRQAACPILGKRCCRRSCVDRAYLGTTNKRDNPYDYAASRHTEA